MILTLNITRPGRFGLIRDMLAALPYVKVVDSEDVVIEAKNEIISGDIDLDPVMLFGKWADFDIDAKSLRRESWRREGF